MGAGTTGEGRFGPAKELAGAEVPGGATTVGVDGVGHRLRAAEPPHDLSEARDADGRWRSPDCKVAAAAGQSDMLGSGQGGDLSLDGSAMAWDRRDDRVRPTDRLSPPAGGPGLRFDGEVPFNDLHLAGRLDVETEQPALAIARLASGSGIEDRRPAGRRRGRQPGGPRRGGPARATRWGGTASPRSHGRRAGRATPTRRTRSAPSSRRSQVRAQDWAGEHRPLVVGEPPREGGDQARDDVLPQVEQGGTFEAPGFASSVGLTASPDDTGVHSDGPSPVVFGAERYWLDHQQPRGLAEMPGDPRRRGRSGRGRSPSPCARAPRSTPRAVPRPRRRGASAGDDGDGGGAARRVRTPRRRHRNGGRGGSRGPRACGCASRSTPRAVGLLDASTARGVTTADVKNTTTGGDAGASAALRAGEGTPRLRTAGAAEIDVIGSRGDERIFGNEADSALDARGGADRVRGGGMRTASCSPTRGRATCRGCATSTRWRATPCWSAPRASRTMT